MFSTLMQPSDAHVDPPEELLCPITLSLFQDPVVCEDGFTYERQAIEQWLRDGGKSPMTNLPLGQRFLPNQNMKSRVLEWKERQASRLVMPLPFHLHDALYVIKSPELDQLRPMIHRSLRHLSEQFQIVRVERNVNERLWASYAAKRKAMTDQGIQIHEAYGFHGCSSIANLDAILQRNFDPTLSNGGPCGKGIYLSSAIVYPVQTNKITWTDEEKTQCKIIAARAVFGNCVVGTEELRCAPHGAQSTFTLAMGGHVFCIYDATQIYPELAVHLKRIAVLEDHDITDWSMAASEAIAKAGAIEMVEPILSNPLIEFYESPGHPCEYRLPEAEKRRGRIVGKGEDGKIAVFPERVDLVSDDDDDNEVQTIREEVVFVEKDQVFPDDRIPIALPWKGQGICFSAPHLSEPLVEILEENIEGLTANKRGVKTTFLSVFSTYRLYGVAMFFIGGAVRHALTEDFKGINDVDVTYGQHPKVMKDIAEAVGFGPIEIVAGIKTQWGTGKFVMEGNPIQSFSVRWTPELTENRIKTHIISNDLVDNLITMDFTCNSVAFDPVQDIFIDASGYGLYDIQKRLIRVPVSRDQWDLWYYQNKRKPFRYWKMRMLNYSAASNEFHDFMCQKSVESLEDNTEGGAEKLLNVICKVTRYRSHVLPKFKKLFCQEMNEAEKRQVIAKGATERVWKAIAEAYNGNQ
ncbi:unnamed protein product [Adineta ricciae]|uniref:U-box domain-containing protein n=1 Tax=Adineta ricciae TaxID=249248 RepID=A0A815QR89_ADIRI|nr:unnamed protein product [Adineta ricciae]